MQILMIGLGAMGGALLKCLENDYTFTVIDPFKDGCLVSIDCLPEGYCPDVVIIAVKPQSMAEVLPSYAKFSKSLFISIAAGITCESYKKWLGDKVRLARVMPNLAVQVAESASAFVLNENCKDNDIDLVQSIFAKVGIVKQLYDERLFDEITALSGSGPAYVYYLCECLEESAKELGLDQEFAQIFARQTIIGAAATLKKLHDSPEKMRTNVTSEGGATKAALDVLMEGKAMQKLFSNALVAARDRCFELSRSI